MQLAIYTALFLSLITSSLAYRVLAPGDQQGWVFNKPGRITWTRVNTDPKDFVVALTRVQPPYYSVISGRVNGGLPDQNHSVDIPTPRGGFPDGDHFRINLMGADADNQGTIHAQSNEFTIKKD